MLAGMAATFAVVSTLAAVGGGWAVRANDAGRWAALVLLALFGIALVFPGVSDRMTRPLVALGSRLSEREGKQDSIWSSAVLGIATGLLWAPCAGPILGLIFTGAALQGASINTTLLLLAYALGAATSLALALLVGGKVFARMKKSLGASERIRQFLGILVLIGVGPSRSVWIHECFRDCRELRRPASKTAWLRSSESLVQWLTAALAQMRWGSWSWPRRAISRRSTVWAHGSTAPRSTCSSFAARSC